MAAELTTGIMGPHLLYFTVLGNRVEEDINAQTKHEIEALIGRRRLCNNICYSRKNKRII